MVRDQIHATGLFAKIGKHRLLISAALLRGAAELGERHYGNPQFLGQRFEAAGDSGDLLGAVSVAPDARPKAEAVINCR